MGKFAVNRCIYTLSMKDFLIYVKLESYLAEWLTHSFGYPVRFPDQSVENAIIHQYLTVREAGALVDTDKEGKVPIVITDSSLRRPEYYNHFGQRGQAALIRHLDNLFRVNLWSECVPLITFKRKRKLNAGLDEWCYSHGISLDHREAVRQKFYRMRKKYESYGIILGNFHKKKQPRECNESY